MLILAIETSCDDTCVSIADIRKGLKIKILSNIVSSQTKLHAKYGGVYPTLAKREHQKNLPLIFKKAVKESGISLKNLDAIVVTSGPGLEPCLWTGIVFARELSKELKKPLMPVNHIEAHALVNLLNSDFKKLLPAVCLIVSGGHTQLILMKKPNKYKIIGETRDDAAGECLDKTARILGLGYPGGPIISELAEKGKQEMNLPRPMIHQKNYDFSFSGLKTAVLYDFQSRKPKIRESKQYVCSMAKEIEQAVIDVLLKKTLKAAKDFKVKSVILGGGVVANKELKKQFQEAAEKENLKLIFPEPRFCTDNALMAAIAGFLNFSKKKTWKKIEANANLRVDENA
jgi:N6-L-threonylcarbamoyladenine synthase